MHHIVILRKDESTTLFHVWWFDNSNNNCAKNKCMVGNFVLKCESSLINIIPVLAVFASSNVINAHTRQQTLLSIKTALMHQVPLRKQRKWTDRYCHKLCSVKWSQFPWCSMHEGHGWGLSLKKSWCEPFLSSLILSSLGTRHGYVWSSIMNSLGLLSSGRVKVKGQKTKRLCIRKVEMKTVDVQYSGIHTHTYI